MAKTNVSDVFAVTPKFVQSAIDKRTKKERVFPWYLAGMTKNVMENLKTVGEATLIETKAGRIVVVVSAASVKDGDPVTFRHPVTNKQTTCVIDKTPTTV